MTNDLSSRPTTASGNDAPATAEDNAASATATADGCGMLTATDGGNPSLASAATNRNATKRDNATTTADGGNAAAPDDCGNAAVSTSSARAPRPNRRSSHSLPLRAAMCAGAVLLGFFLIEFPWNTSLFSLSALHVAANLGVLAALFAVVYFAGQRTRGAVVAFLAACLVAGLANHYVIAFKGQPVQPADLFALGTAFSVSGGYSFAPDWRVILSVALFALACVALHFAPKAQLTRTRVGANLLAALVVAGMFWGWFDATDIEEDLDCEVGIWFVRDSYEENGATLSFLKRMQDLSVDAPEGYSSEAAQAVLARYADDAEGDGAEEGDEGDEGSEGNADSENDAEAQAEGIFEASEAYAAEAETETESESESATGETLPTVIVVMNETFSDLSRYPGLEGTAAYPENFYAIAASSLASGLAYASTVSGGTCNSEFEFLTGSSMANLGDGSYPYVTYNLNGVDNLAAYFGSLGYTTSAVHPAEATNWRRDRVYAQLGFDAFYSEDSFQDADQLRGLATDRATYDLVLDLIEESDDPQFVFDVTIQNHSGYTTGLLPEELQVDVGLDAADATSGYGSAAELNEYAACIQQSDEDLAYLIESLSAMDEPVVVCFFGDHQPSFTEWLYEATYGQPAGEADLNGVQSRYAVPYFIWANYDANGTEESKSAAESPQSAANTGSSPNTTETVTGVDGTAQADAATQADADEAAPIDSAGAALDETPTSLNYLGAQLVGAAGLPTTSYQKFLLAVADEVPVMNTNGYLTSDGIWHERGEETEASSLLSDYRIVQYANLFDKD